MNSDLLQKIINYIMQYLKKEAPKKLVEPVKPIQVVIEDRPPQEAANERPKIEPLTKEDLLKGRDKSYPNDYTQEISDNLDKLLIVLNKVQDAYGEKLEIESGWRSPAINAATPGAATLSNHMKGLAGDIKDPKGKLMNWCLENLQLMKELGIYFEDFRWTPTWTHMQIIAPKSGNRIYIPNKNAALAPDRWVGKYSAKFN
jgi:uncharacterized protein YcbK (DUF882 family)